MFNAIEHLVYTCFDLPLEGAFAAHNSYAQAGRLGQPAAIGLQTAVAPLQLDCYLVLLDPDTLARDRHDRVPAV
jgi:hypothetical protein